MGGIYVYWFKNTGLDNCEQSYVGSTESFTKRHRDHIKALLRNKHPNNNFQHAFNKYGEENMVYEQVDKMLFPPDYSRQLKRDYLESREFYHFNVLNSSYNLCIPGFNTYSLKTDKEKTLFSSSKKEVYLVDENLKIINKYSSVREAGRILKLNSNCISLVARLKRKSTSGMIFRYVDNLKIVFTKEKKIDSRLGKPREGAKRPVLCYYRNGVFYREFPSIKEAAAYLNIRTCGIGLVCRGTIKTTNNWIFKYKTKSINYKLKNQ